MGAIRAVYSSQAVAADVGERHMPLPYQLAKNLLSVMSFCFSLRNLLGFSLFFKMRFVLAVLSCPPAKVGTAEEF